MTKRRWLKSAIEQSKKTEVSIPWQSTALRIDPTYLAAARPTAIRPDA